jgi:hypothetical protein
MELIPDRIHYLCEPCINSGGLEHLTGLPGLAGLDAIC